MSILKVKNKLTGKWEEVQAIKGEPGKDGKDGINGKDGVNGKDGKDGKDGEKGDSYIITENDYNAIAQIVLDNLPNAEGADF